MKLKLIIMAGITMAITMAHGKNLGQYGPLFEMAEKDLLGAITQKLGDLDRSGQLAALQADLQEKITQKIKRPPPTVRSVTTSPRTWIMDPSLIVSRDLMDSNARVFAKKGTWVWPSTHLPFGEPLIFVDGDDPTQVSWGLAQSGRLVLTNGNPFALANQYQRSIYFDQFGRLTTIFKSIMSLPQSRRRAIS